MGCGESKIKNINLSPDPNDKIEMTKAPNTEVSSPQEKDEGLPNRLLSAIPISDLGESLDSRHLSESFNGGPGGGKSQHFTKGSGSHSVDSNDSGTVNFIFR